jgi:hypothetical protein
MACHGAQQQKLPQISLALNFFPFLNTKMRQCDARNVMEHRLFYHDDARRLIPPKPGTVLARIMPRQPFGQRKIVRPWLDHGTGFIAIPILGTRPSADPSSGPPDPSRFVAHRCLATNNDSVPPAVTGTERTTPNSGCSCSESGRGIRI